MICYDRLWATMEKRGMTQYRLIKQHNFSAGQIGRLKKNMHVSTHTLDTLCTILECGINDLVEFIPEKQKQKESEPMAPDTQDVSGKETLSPAKRKKSEPARGDNIKKAGKSKKGDKKTGKEKKKGKDNKKNK